MKDQHQRSGLPLATPIDYLKIVDNKYFHMFTNKLRYESFDRIRLVYYYLNKLRPKRFLRPEHDAGIAYN